MGRQALTTRRFFAPLALALLLGACAGLLPSFTAQTGWRDSFPKKIPEAPTPLPERLVEPLPVTFDAAGHLDPLVNEKTGLLLYASDRGGNWDLWARPLISGLPRLLTDWPSRETAPALSPDAEHLVFVSNRHDPQGDIYRVSIENGTQERGDAKPVRLPRPRTEEASPLWLSDKEILFTSLHGGTWKLFRYNWEESGAGPGEITMPPVSDHEVRMPALAPALSKNSPRVIAFIARSEEGPSGLYVSSLPEKDAELKAVRVFSGAPIESYPAWGEIEEGNWAWLYYARYLDDTNLDGLVTPEDNSSLWRVRVSLIPGSAGPLGEPEPLTGGGGYDFSPKPSEAGLYFIRQEQGRVGIYRLPLGGRAAGLEASAAQLSAILEWEAPYSRLLALRWIAAQAGRSGERSLAARARYEIAGIFEEIGNLAAALSMHGKLVEEDAPGVSALSKLAIVRLESRVLAAASLGKDRNRIVAEEIASYETRLREAAQESSKGGERLLAQALFELARIELDFGFPVRALDRISEIEKKYSSERPVLAHARLFRAEVFASRGNRPAFQEVILGVLRDFSGETQVVAGAIRRLLSETARLYPDIPDRIEAFRRLTDEFADVPRLSTAASLELARLYEEAGRLSAARREYEHLLRDPSLLPEERFSAVTGLSLVLASEGEPDAALQALSDVKVPEGDISRLEALLREWAARLLEAADRARRAGHPAEALRIYEAIAARVPEVPEAHYGRIELTENPSSLSGEYAAKLRDHPATAHYALALIVLRKDGTPDLSDILSDHVVPAIVLDPGIPAFHHLKGYIHEISETVYGRQKGAGGLEEAIDAYRSALYLVGNDGRQKARRQELLLALANAYFSFPTPNHSEAWRYYKEWLASGGSTDDPQRKLLLEERMARSAFHSGELDSAIAHAARGAEIARGLGLLSRRLKLLEYEAFCLQEKGEYGHAAERLEQTLLEGARRLDKPSRARLHRSLAYNRYRLGREEEALGDLQEARDLLAASGGASYGRGRWDDKVRKRLGLTPQGELAVNFTYEGRVLEEMGDVRAAVDAQREKIALLADPGKKGGEDQLQFWERRSIGWNRIGRLEYERAVSEDARQALEASLEEARLAVQLRGKGLAAEGLARLSMELKAGGSSTPEGVDALLSEAIRDLDDLRQSGGKPDLLVLARLYHARALLRVSVRGQKEKNGIGWLDPLEDFAAAERMLLLAERQGMRGLSGLRISIGLNEAAALERLGFSALALEKTRESASGARRFRLPCLEMIADFSLVPFDPEALERAHGKALDLPPALCREVSPHQLRRFHTALYEALLEKTGDPAESLALVEEKAQLDLAVITGGPGIAFGEPLEQEAWSRARMALDQAEAALAAVQEFKFVEGSLESERALAVLQESADKTIKESGSAWMRLFSDYPSLARLLLPSVPKTAQIAEALGNAALLRVKRSGDKILVWRVDSKSVERFDSSLPPELDGLVNAWRVSGRATDGDWADLRRWWSMLLAPVREGLGHSLYIIADDDLAVLPWGEVGDVLGAKPPAVAQAGSLAHLWAVHERRNGNKRRGILVAQTDAASDEDLNAPWLVSFHEKLAQRITGLRGFYFRDNGREEFVKTIRDAGSQQHFIHVFSELSFARGLPLQTSLSFPSPPLEGALPDLSLRAWTELSAQANVAVFENATGEFSGEGLSAFAYFSALAGIPSVVMQRVSTSRVPPPEELSFYLSVYDALVPDKEGKYLPVGEALLRARSSSKAPGDVRLLGHLGLASEEALSIAQKELNRFAGSAVQAAQAGDFGKAARFAQRAVQFMDVVGVPDQPLSQMLSVAATTLKKSNQLEGAIAYEDRQAKLLERAGALPALVQALFFLGKDLSQLGRHEEAQSALGRAVEFARKLGKKDFEIIVLSELARSLELGGKPVEAMARYGEALALASETGDKISAEELEYNAGRVAHERLGDESLAEKHLSAALSIAESLGKGAERNAARDALTLSLTQLSRGRFRAALEVLEKLLPLAGRLGDKALEAQGLVYRGAALRETGRLREALSDLKQAERLAGEAKVQAVLADASSAASLVLLDLGQTGEAREKAQKALDLSDNDFARAAASHNLALVYLEAGDFGAARELAAKALDLARKRNAAAAEADELFLLAGIGRGEGRDRRRVLEELASVCEKYMAAGLLVRGLECRVAFLEWGGELPDTAGLERAVGELQRQDLLARLYFLRGDFQKAAEAFLLAEPSSARWQERRGFDPERGMSAAREAVFGLAKEGKIEEAHSLWELSRAARRRALLALESPRLSRERGGPLVEKLFTLWAEARNEASPQELAALRGQADAAALELQKLHPETHALLFSSGNSPVLRQKELGDGEILLDFVAGRERTFVFALSAAAPEGFWVEEGSKNLGQRAKAFREIVASFGRYEEERKQLFEKLLAPAFKDGIQRFVVISDEQLAGLLFEALIPDSFSVSLSRLASLALPLRRGRTSFPGLAIAVFGDFPAESFAGALPPPVRQRPSPSQRALWDKEILGLARASGIFQYQRAGDVSEKGPVLPGATTLAIHCASAASGNPVSQTRCGGKEGFLLASIEGLDRPPVLLGLPGLAELSSQEVYELSLWGEWMTEGAAAVFGAGRHPVAGARFAKYFYGGLSRKSPLSSFVDARGQVREIFGHPAYWAGFFYQGPLD
ncbi:MAG: tetratricopeptide repeat protein [Bdellovibrionota bacterium]